MPWWPLTSREVSPSCCLTFSFPGLWTLGLHFCCLTLPAGNLTQPIRLPGSIWQKSCLKIEVYMASLTCSTLIQGNKPTVPQVCNRSFGLLVLCTGLYLERQRERERGIREARADSSGENQKRQDKKCKSPFVQACFGQWHDSYISGGFSSKQACWLPTETPKWHCVHNHVTKSLPLAEPPFPWPRNRAPLWPGVFPSMARHLTQVASVPGPMWLWFHFCATSSHQPWKPMRKSGKCLCHQAWKQQGHGKGFWSPHSPNATCGPQMHAGKVGSSQSCCFSASAGEGSLVHMMQS